MKNRYTNLGLLVVVIAAAVLATACPKPKSTTVSGGCVRNMTTGVVTCNGVVTVVFDRGAQVEEGSEIIVDIPNGWSSNFSNANLDFQANYGTSEAANFNVPLSPTTSTVSPVETGSSVHTFIGDATSIQTAEAAQDSENESQFTSQFAFTQASCDLPPGEYTFHFRSKDSTGVTYIGATTVVYQVATEGSCVGSSATVKQ